MGQIIIPTNNKIKGPWLLDNKGLEDLDEILKKIEGKLNDAFNLCIDRTAEENLEEYQRWDKEIDIEKAKLKVKNSYPFTKSEKHVLIITKQGKKIKEDDFLSLLKDPQINEFNPTELRIQIEKGPCEFTLEISTEYSGVLETRIKVLDNSILNDINYEINKWATKYKSNVAIQIWSRLFPVTSFIILIILTITTSWILKDKSDLYKVQLSQEINLLLKDGLTENETTKAIELILQKESGYIPETFNPEITVNKTLINIWLFTIIVLAILIIKPRTVIGLGKDKWKVGFYRRWTYFVLFFIPSMIALPIIINKLT
jgi:hypothetical protein